MSTDALLEERGQTHGDYSEHARITQNIKHAMRAGNYHTLPPEMVESLDMIAHKIGRILAGNPRHKDHWADICGYARLVELILDRGGIGVDNEIGRT